MHRGGGGNVRHWLGARGALVQGLQRAQGGQRWLLLTLALLLSPLAMAQVSYVYDEIGRLVQTVAPDGASVQYSYDPAGNINGVRRTAADALSLVEFTPNAGPVGTSVTLYGSNFTAPNTVVKFNGKVATVKPGATANVMTVKVPSGATTGKISVSNASGNVSSATNFVVGVGVPMPTITGFTPDIGKTGDLVSISGTNYQAAATDNKIAFGQAYARTLTDADSPSPTLLKTNVPAGVPSGQISVTTKYGKAVSATDFYAVPAGYAATDFEVKTRLTVGGPMRPITISTPGKKALVIFDAPAGQYLNLVTRSGTFPGAVTAEVYRPDGTKVESLSTAKDGVEDFVNIIGSNGGTYTMVLRPTGTETGTVNVNLVQSVRGTIGIDTAEPKTVKLGVGQNGRYTFSGSAGQVLHLLVSKNLMDDGNSGTTDYTF
ncbi:MAG TPA: IPT/TIG domain-containing protein, partial [Ideonella sp.]|uniref:IPT/TIG domain-containing protein n=1 Tax=Ideonella sp. TaxID=1929293 RepID=UPI002E32159E